MTVLSGEQFRVISRLSDDVLYPEAVAFVNRQVRELHRDALLNSQANGLLNIATSLKYSELQNYVIHQRTRDWQPSKRDIGAFYEDLERYLNQLQRTRLQQEFHLLSSGLSPEEGRREREEVLAYLALEFIQHLVAENGIWAAQQEAQRQQNRGGNRGQLRNQGRSDAPNRMNNPGRPNNQNRADRRS